MAANLIFSDMLEFFRPGRALTTIHRIIDCYRICLTPHVQMDATFFAIVRTAAEQDFARVRKRVSRELRELWYQMCAQLTKAAQTKPAE